MRRQLAAFTLLIASAGCSSFTDSGSGELTGTWQTARESLQPAGSWQTTLTFDGNGHVTMDSRDFGLYGQRPNDLSAYYQTRGTFQIDGDSLRMQAQELVWWDRFYGADSPEHHE